MNKPYVAFSEDELRSLMAETTKVNDTRCYVLFFLSVTHGLRVSEALALTRSDFAEAGGKLYLTVARLKGSEKTTQEVADSGLVSAYLSSLTGDRLFDLGRSGVDYLIKRYGKRAGLPQHKLHAHAFKHSLGTLMRKNGADIVQIKNALGHADVRNTMMYLRPTADEVEHARISALSITSLAFAAAR